MMKTFSPGRISPSSRRATSSIAEGSSRSRRLPRAGARCQRARGHGRSQLIVFLPRPHHGEQPAFADQAIGHEGQRHEHHEQLEHSAASTGTLLEVGFQSVIWTVHRLQDYRVAGRKGRKAILQFFAAQP
jgi:hypothetical protein